jgi:hypothetical protein
MNAARTFKPLESWCESFAAQPSMSVVPPIVTFYDGSQMWDSLHANSDGAWHFTADVARAFGGLWQSAHGVSRFGPIVARDVQEALNPPAR